MYDLWSTSLSLETMMNMTHPCKVSAFVQGKFSSRNPNDDKLI